MMLTDWIRRLFDTARTPKDEQRPPLCCPSCGLRQDAWGAKPAYDFERGGIQMRVVSCIACQEPFAAPREIVEAVTKWDDDTAD